MGTSGSFGGSGGKDAGSLRDSISEWLDATPADTQSESTASDEASQNPVDLRPALRLLRRGLRGTEAGGGGSGGAGESSRSDGRSSGGPRRSVPRMSTAAARAGGLASAYAAGDRTTLAEAGINYDELAALDDPIEVGYRIARAALETNDGTTEAQEESEIAAELIDWVLKSPADNRPSPEDIARKSIELIIAEVTLTEIAQRMRETVTTSSERDRLESMVRDASEELAAQAPLSASGATTAEIARTIENGVSELINIFGGDQ